MTNRQHMIYCGKPHLHLRIFMWIGMLLLVLPSFAQPEYSVPGKIFTSVKKASAQPDSVQRLRLRRNGLQEIPQEIFLMKNLRELDLGSNKIKRIPPEIAQLTSLEILRLDRNKLKLVPDEVGTLVNIRYLDLGRNEIQFLPPAIGNMESLEFLQIWGNDIANLPDMMGRLKQLKWLDMRAIILSDSEKELISDLFPETEIFFSAGCNCGK